MIEVKDFIKQVLQDVPGDIESVGFELCIQPSGDGEIVLSSNEHASKVSFWVRRK